MKENTALLRLYTGHDCLNEHLNRFGLKTSKFCTICNSPASINKDHLLQCRNLDPNKQARRDLVGIYIGKQEAYARFLEREITVLQRYRSVNCCVSIART